MTHISNKEDCMMLKKHLGKAPGIVNLAAGKFPGQQLFN